MLRKPDHNRSHGGKQAKHRTAKQCLAKAERLEQLAAASDDPATAADLRSMAHGFRLIAASKESRLNV